MRKTAFVVAAAVILTGFCAVRAAQAQTCTPTKIQSGTLVDVKGNPLTLGYDKYGYNYQAHLFNGLSQNYTRPAVVVTEGNENLVMKWSDDWLANVSCDGTGALARGYDARLGTFSGSNPNGTSKGWVTNHYEGDYTGSDGESHHYEYFAKIVYDAGAACGASSSSCIWGLYSIIEEIQNDPYGQYGTVVAGDPTLNGKIRNKLVAPGLGKF